MKWSPWNHNSITYASQFDDHVWAWRYGELGQHDAHITDMRRHWYGVFIYVYQHDAHTKDHVAYLYAELTS